MPAIRLLKDNVYLLIVLAIGFALRFSISFIHSYSSDELSAINRLNYPDFRQLMHEGVMMGDMHPAGVQLFEKLWSTLFGTSELALRFPFVLMGLLSVWFVYRVGKRWLNRKTALIAAALLSVTYFPVIHSELARPYSPGLLFSLMTTYYFLSLLFPVSAEDESRSAKWKYSLLLTLSFLLAMYTHYFAFMFVGFVGFTGLFYLKRSNYIPYLAACVGSIVLFLPHIGITIYQLSVDGGLQWLGKPSNTWIFEFIYHAFNESLILTAAVALLILFALFAPRNTAQNGSGRLVFLFSLWFFGIYVIAHLYSLFASPILKFPVMLFALPFLFLVIATPFARLKTSAFNLCFGLILLLGVTSTVFEKNLYGNRHFGVFRELVEPMQSWRKRYGSENIRTYMNVSNPNYLNYYALQSGDSLTFNRHVIEFSDHKAIRNELLRANEEYCIIGYSSRYTPPQIFETCLEFYPNIIEYVQLENCGVFLLSKKNKGIGNRKRTLLSSFEAKDKVNKGWRYKKDAIYRDSSGMAYYKSDSTHLFGPEFRIKAKDLKSDEDTYLYVSIDAEGSDNAEITATVSALRNGEVVMDNENKPLWLGMDMEEMLNRPEANGRGYFAFVLPKEIHKDDELIISIWNRNGGPVRIRKISVEAVENIWN